MPQSLLRKAGLHSVPVVAGKKKITQGARQAVCEQNVAFVQDGHVELWEEVVANWVDMQLTNY